MNNKNNEINELVANIPTTVELQDKYQLEKEENVFLAKKLMVDSIWKNARLEGVNITFADTYAIVNKMKLQSADINDINTILNLKHAWNHIISTCDLPLTLDYICSIQNEVSRDEALTWGKLRDGKIGISGTEYVPKIPQKENVEQELQELLKIKPNTYRAIKIMLWVMRSQLFWDGNKRTGLLAANKELIKGGNGIFSITIEDLPEFNTLLTEYYDTGKDDKLISFLYKTSVKGIEFISKKERENKE